MHIFSFFQIVQGPNCYDINLSPIELSNLLEGKFKKENVTLQYLGNEFDFTDLSIHKNFNKEHFVGKLKKRSKMFSGCVNTLQWYDVIKKVYNTRNQRHRVEFTPIKED